MATKENIIFALDSDSLAKATPYIEALSPYVGMFKVGLELLTAQGAPSVIHHIHRLGGQVFFDGKFDDIPNTVGAASRAVSSMGVKMFNVHASCGLDSLKAAADNKGNALLLVVTVLTSIPDAESQRIFGAQPHEKVIQFAHDAKAAGADGIICSPQELELLAQIPDLRSLLKVTPGVRPEWAEANDQKRILTPAQAMKMGATHLVIGRPISNPPRGIGSPIDAAKKILEEILNC
ncbi:MAG: orotidine-5'-phosphate decarboxylase [Deltaproteobacteria bacterium]